ncbi:Coenzyme F420 hydrogenase/dehydrogenase, beta subunit C-terminal domain [Pontiella agarivorans]|uniref:Coenzyme F420 hydrogenase/dehydrogenase, beta subunit C-terminal domain n=1 Tax=Pontiella agarivorans TaxID=3038953 RepID=A0ABU5MT02_9BACT|nr:Coenzyme F420 hydrogenase/dehydrogenase, beta subunit C-terminal domain [Pontiella agarivorans]MDZ8117323.1 Coenzyme F420 hydrogenase/dehydrogenase, beta subunit C-terminal domain [Pontiella agarivorans]
MHELQKVIDGGYCIGCGACSYAGKNSIELVEDEYRRYQGRIKPESQDQDLDAALAVCPFSNHALNESEISRRVFSHDDGSTDEVIGYNRSLYAGFVSEGDYRERCNSGGMITWMLIQLLEKGIVDAVIHVKKSSRHGTLFEYGISKNCDDVLNSAKSRYYPVEISRVMETVRSIDGRYVFVGLPCFIKSVRNLAKIDSLINDRIILYIGLVCGHLKSKTFANLFAWQAGVPEGQLSDIDFRVKMEGRTANAYGVKITDENGEETLLQSKDCYGVSWGHNFFKYEACDYCDDVFAETADVVVGDAWLPGYVYDSKGNSIVVIRNEIFDNLINSGMHSGQLALDVLTAKEVRESQAGGIRHRRGGLSYRLYLKKKRGSWVPDKRVDPENTKLSFGRKMIFRYRMHLRVLGYKAWDKAIESDDFKVFVRKTKLHLKIYDRMVRLNKKYESILFSKNLASDKDGVLKE